MTPNRREFLKGASAAGVVAVAGRPVEAGGRQGQRGSISDVRTVQTAVLDIAVEEHGVQTGFPIMLLHGFPYDVR